MYNNQKSGLIKCLKGIPVKAQGEMKWSPV